GTAGAVGGVCSFGQRRLVQLTTRRRAGDRRLRNSELVRRDGVGGCVGSTGFEDDRIAGRDATRLQNRRVHAADRPARLVDATELTMPEPTRIRCARVWA